MISVIMPAYNAEPYIAAAIASVLAQDHTDLELLVVDNNSTDGTVAVVQGFNDPRIRLLSQPVQGVSAARNRALEEMRGDFFCFLDADDDMPVQSLSARMAVFTRPRPDGLQSPDGSGSGPDPRIHFVDGTVCRMDATMQRIQEVWRPTFTGVPYAPLLQLSPSCFVGSTWMIRRVAGRTYRFDERLTHAEDLLFFLGIARDGIYTYTPATILRYRRGHTSAMTDLRGVHKGYRGLMLAVQALPDPPDKATLNDLWRRLRRILWRSYLKSGQPIRSLRAYLEPRP